MVNAKETLPSKCGGDRWSNWARCTMVGFYPNLFPEQLIAKRGFSGENLHWPNKISLAELPLNWCSCWDYRCMPEPHLLGAKNQTPGLHAWETNQLSPISSPSSLTINDLITTSSQYWGNGGPLYKLHTWVPSTKFWKTPLPQQKPSYSRLTC